MWPLYLFAMFLIIDLCVYCPVTPSFSIPDSPPPLPPPLTPFLLQVLHVKEVFTTEGFLHLSLPETPDGETHTYDGTAGVAMPKEGEDGKTNGENGQAAAGAGMWEIESYETKEVRRDEREGEGEEG